MEDIKLKTLLQISGYIALCVGIGMTFYPLTFFSISGVYFSADASTINELRAPGCATLFAALFIIWGSKSEKHRHSALLFAVILFLGFGAGRVLSLVFDGIPNPLILFIMASELTIGAVCVYSLVRYNKNNII